MRALPPHDSRVLQAVDILKEEIVSGRLGAVLPGERELAQRLRISRATLQKALSYLEGEQWISRAEPRHRRRILKQAGKRAVSEPSLLRGKVVVTLATLPMSEMPATVRLDHAHLGGYCAEMGIRLMHRELDVSHMKRPAHKLKEFVKQNPADIYLLLLSSKETQEWFSRTGTPCIVLGTAWPHCQLSSADWDQSALGFHVGGKLSTMGHKKVGMLYPTPSKHGIEIFVSSFKKAAPEIDLILAKQDDAPESIRKGLVSLLSRKTNRPTVIILPRIFYAMAAVSAVPSMGFSVPDQVSLLCLVYDDTFRYFSPTLASYRVPPLVYPKAIFKLLTEKLKHPDSVDVRDALIMPDFVPAGSLSKVSLD